jgi:ADP-heptose:LPS heptosyltransferase
MRREERGTYRLPKQVLKAAYSFVVRSVYPQRYVSKLPLGGENSILVIRTDGLGDLMLALPSLRHLRESFGSHRITLLTRQEWVGLMQRCPYVDEVIGWDIRKYARNIFYRVSFVRGLRKRVYGEVFHPPYSREPLSDELLCCCLAARKIGFDGDLNNISPNVKARNDSHYTKLIDLSVKGAPEIDRNREFTERVTGKRVVPADFQPKIWLAESDRKQAGSLLGEAGLDPKRDLIVVLFPGASWDGKSWPAVRYAELADRIIQEHGAKIVICGARTDMLIATLVQSKMKGSVVNLAGKTSLPVLAALFELCALYIGNDTGPLHLAVSVGTATLGIVGGGHFGRFYPYGDLNRQRVVFKEMECYHCNWKCIHESIRCIQEIAVDDVWAATQRIMNEVVVPERERGLQVQDGATLRR